MKCTVVKKKLTIGILFVLSALLCLFWFKQVFTKDQQLYYKVDSEGVLNQWNADETGETEWIYIKSGETKIYTFLPEYEGLKQITTVMDYVGESTEGTIQFRLYTEENDLLVEEQIPLKRIYETFTKDLILDSRLIEVSPYFLEITFEHVEKGERAKIQKGMFMLYSRYNNMQILFAALLILICGILWAVKFEIKNKWIKIGIVGMIPILNYILFESVTGNLFTINGIYLYLNLIFFYCFYLLLFGITNRLRFTLLFMNIATYFIAVSEYYVVLFRGRPIMIWDLLAIGTAATVAGNYQYEITANIILPGLCMLALCLFLRNVKYRMVNKKKRIALSFGVVGSIILYFYVFYGKMITKYELTINMWAPAASYSSSGYALSTFVYLDYIRVRKPDGYSPERVKELEEELGRAAELSVNQASVTPTNIICIMNESFSDLKVVGDFKTNIEYMPFIDGLTENTIKGNLYTPVFGSMTCNPEFEFLTGNSTSFLPAGTIAYQIYINGLTHSIPRILGELNYETIAIHPYPGANWNRNKVFDYMGFDSFLEGDYFEQADRIRHYASDWSTYETVIELVEAKEKDSPLFIFDITMQNHGGYTGGFYNFEPDVSLTEYTEFPQAENYLSLIKQSDEAFKELLSYFSEIEEPTMVVMFGDHQPSIEPEFYEELYGKAFSELESEEQIRQYITPFIIWTNYEMESEYMDQLSASYLSTLMFEKANLPMSPYLQYISDMMKEVPVIHPLGYYDKKGKYYTWAVWEDSPYYSYFKDFYILQHNNLFDLRKRMDGIFTLDPEQIEKD